MQINNMLPILLNMLKEQAGSQKVDKSGSKQARFDLDGQMEKKTAEAATTPVTDVKRAGEENAVKTTQQPTPGINLPDFLPLPLKSPLFAESRFFVKNDREESESSAENAPGNILIHLRTGNLGLLWIALSARNDTLTVSFYTEDDSYTALINKIAPEMAEGLKKIGYSQVKAAGITRPGIKSCSDIVPGLTGARAYILDLEV